jgi:hypothetical protein
VTGCDFASNTKDLALWLTRNARKNGVEVVSPLAIERLIGGEMVTDNSQRGIDKCR